MKATNKGKGNTTIGYSYKPDGVTARLMRALTVGKGDGSMTFQWMDRDTLLGLAGIAETDDAWRQALAHLGYGEHIERRIEQENGKRVEYYRRITPVSELHV